MAFLHSIALDIGKNILREKKHLMIGMYTLSQRIQESTSTYRPFPRFMNRKQNQNEIE